MDGVSEIILLTHESKPHLFQSVDASTKETLRREHVVPQSVQHRVVHLHFVSNVNRNLAALGRQ